MTAPRLPQRAAFDKRLGLTPAELRRLLIKRYGINVKALAAAEGFHASYAQHILTNPLRRWHAGLARRIAIAIRLSVSEAFPERAERRRGRAA